MRTKFTCPMALDKKLIQRLDTKVKQSKGRYRNRSHLVEILIEKGLEKEDKLW